MSAWEPLEGTPSTLNTLAEYLGLDTKLWKFVDVLGLDDDALALTIPPPPNNIAAGSSCGALILLYPTNDEGISTYFTSVMEKTAADYIGGDEQQGVSSITVHNCIFLGQTIGGICGDIATVHAIANTTKCCQDAVTRDSPLYELNTKYEMFSTTSPANKAQHEEQSPSDWFFLGLDSVKHAHEKAVEHMNQENTSTPSSLLGQRQGRHFVTWVHKDGRLWELDGRRPEGPTCRGTTSESRFLSDATSIAREVLAASKDESLYARCSVLALICTG